jgi:hypothetical protein
MSNLGAIALECYVCLAKPLNPEWDVDAGFIDCVNCFDSGTEPIPLTEFE